MKKILVSLLLLTACISTERYVSMVQQAEPKAAMIEAPAIITQLTFQFHKNKLEIHQSTETIKFLGAGVFISPNGHLLTCAHLFHPTNSLITVVTVDGVRLPATLLYKDGKRDLALLKVDAHTPYVRLAKNEPTTGQEVIAIGNPLGLNWTVSHGIVSTLNRDIGEGFAFTQIDAPINQGNSGGPLFNMNGELIGINARKEMDTDGIAFAISLKTINEFLDLFRGVKI